MKPTRRAIRDRDEDPAPQTPTNRINLLPARLVRERLEEGEEPMIKYYRIRSRLPTDLGPCRTITGVAATSENNALSIVHQYRPIDEVTEITCLSEEAIPLSRINHGFTKEEKAHLPSSPVRDPRVRRLRG